MDFDQEVVSNLALGPSLVEDIAPEVEGLGCRVATLEEEVIIRAVEDTTAIQPI